MPSKKTMIVKAISKMDISMLEILLDDAKTYQGATKVVFLKKLDEVFEQFKKLKDTHLSPFSGICKSKTCENKGCAGLSFLGNTSNVSIELIFDELENDFKDISQCSNFKIYDKSIKPSNKFRINIKQDEKASFNPRPERLEIFQECKKAFDEIMQDDSLLTKEKLLKWVDDYYWLREELKNNTYFLPFIYRSIDNFRDLYNDLNNVAEHIPYEIQTFDALVDFQKVDYTNEKELLNWLINYENLRYDLSTLYHPFDDDTVKMNYLRIYKQPKIRIDLTEFKNFIQFKSDFDKYYWSMHSKYKIYTDDECEDLESNSDDYKKRFSLKYQLEKREYKF